MTSNEKLTRDEALLLQRYFDDECNQRERQTARELLDASPVAQTYLSALKELQGAVRGAEREAWAIAQVPSPEELMELIDSSTELDELAIDDLAPLLERYYDGEVDATEAAVVEALADRRDDVADYLSELCRLGEGIRQAAVVDAGDFEGFWEGIDDAIEEFEADSDDVEPFDPQRHGSLLHRYHDGEATPRQRRCVEVWLDAGDERVESRLDALEQVEAGVGAAVEHAVEQQNVESICEGVMQQLDTVDAERAADNVVSIDDSADSEAGPGWMKPVMAVAAAVALLTVGALLGPHLLDHNQQPVDTEPVVIFDTIESAPGSSVMLHSPQLADHDATGGGEYEPAVHNGATIPVIEAEDDEADPTVLWVIDDEEDDDDDDDERDPEDETEELPGPI